MAAAGFVDADWVRSELAELDKECEAKRDEVKCVLASMTAALEDRQRMLLAEIDAAQQKQSKHLSGLIEETTAAAAGTLDSPEGSADPGLEINFAFRTADHDKLMASISRFGAVFTSAPLSQARSFAKGAALTSPVVGESKSFTVYSKGLNGESRSMGGDKAVLTADTPGLLKDLRVNDLQDGRFEVCFTPTVAGTHSLRVSLGAQNKANQEIQGSPFTLQVQEPAERKLPDRKNGGRDPYADYDDCFDYMGIRNFGSRR